MWIICCGAKRSGSTLQYNIASRIVELTNTGIRLEHRTPHEFSELLEIHKNDSQFKVFKSHLLTDDIKHEIVNGRAKALYTFRDVRDVVVSYLNKNWVKRERSDVGQLVRNYLNEYSTWMELKEFLLIRKYEEFYNNLLPEIKIVSKYLGIEINDAQARLIAHELDSETLKNHLDSESVNLVSHGRFKFDRNTLLHKNHIQGLEPNQFLGVLNSAEIAGIEAQAHDWLTVNGYHLLSFSKENFLSFSQQGDDYIAWQLLGKKQNGLVVEVGAFDGVHLSNSFSFEAMGWKSICVEPNPHVFTYLEANRGSSINLNCAVVGDPSISEVVFFVEKIGVLSGLEIDKEDIRSRYEKRGLAYEEPQEVRVSAKTLNAIFEECDVESNAIDLISIDVEGYELEVLKGLDLDRFTPGLFIIEANDEASKAAIIAFFTRSKKRYLYLGSNYQNLYFQREDAFGIQHFRTLDFSDFTAVNQTHPLGDSFAIQAVKPLFRKNLKILNPVATLKSRLFRKPG